MAKITSRVKSDIMNSLGQAQINPATEETLQAILAARSGGIPANKATDAYGYQAYSTAGGNEYFFFEDGIGSWYILRIDANSVASYAKGTGGYATVYVSPTSAPSGSPTFASYDATFDNVGASSLNFDTNGNLKVNIQSPLETNGAIPVNIQDQHTNIIDSYVISVTGSPKTLASNTVLGSYTLVLSAGHGFVNGDMVYIADSTDYFMAKILNVATNTLTLDTPIDHVFTTTAAVCFKFVTEMNVDGSSTPAVYEISVGATATVSLDVYSMRFHLLDNTAMDEASFGGMSALTRGLICRKIAADGSQIVYWNVKTNGDFSLFIDNTEYSAKAPSGQYAVMFQWKIHDSHGVSIRVNPGDRLQIIVQDNLTSLTGMECTVQGHEVIN